MATSAITMGTAVSPSPTQRKTPKRLFMCTECHKTFRSKEDLYMHAELCLLEAFEQEASSMLSDMPNLLEDERDSRSTLKSDAPPSLHPESKSQEKKVSIIVSDEVPIEHIMRPPAVYSTSKTKIPSALQRTIDAGNGLKLMVSVERNESDEDEDDVDEDVSVPSRNDINNPLVSSDGDEYKPKMECPTCGLVLYRHNFSTHYRIHTGEMPFQCSYCDKRFRTTSALKVHVRAHTGEKPYICPRCSYACITKRNLDRHIINNHVRDGIRRGPRYRRSRYRLTDPHHEEYLIDLAREQMEKQAETAARAASAAALRFVDEHGNDILLEPTDDNNQMDLEGDDQPVIVDEDGAGPSTSSYFRHEQLDNQQEQVNQQNEESTATVNTNEEPLNSAEGPPSLQMESTAVESIDVEVAAPIDKKVIAEHEVY